MPQLDVVEVYGPVVGLLGDSLHTLAARPPTGAPAVIQQMSRHATNEYDKLGMTYEARSLSTAEERGAAATWALGGGCRAVDSIREPRCSEDGQ